jgi:hypothetical protein
MPLPKSSVAKLSPSIILVNSGRILRTPSHWRSTTQDAWEAIILSVRLLTPDCELIPVHIGRGTQGNAFWHSPILRQPDPKFRMGTAAQRTHALSAGGFASGVGAGAAGSAVGGVPRSSGALAQSPAQISSAFFATKENSNRISRALSLVDRARTSKNFTEKIAFYCSGLEAMFSTSTAELTHQIAERVALISHNAKTERFETFRFVKKCYSLRSKFIHGDTIKGSVSELSDLSSRLDSVCRKAIKTAFEDSEFWKAMSDQESLEVYFYSKIFE